ncbi:MAG: zf-HC2 domain-containing protein [Planctomycetes bacterium]|nr:zf-HC2 domain-containing protein [Planctomycetota bacterium]
MNCAFDKEKLSGYYDGELEAAEKAEVERHIASCSECLRELGELKSAAVLVKELPRLRAPRSIAEGVSREIRSAGQVHNFAKVRRLVLWAGAAAAAALIGLNVMYFSSPEKAILARQAEAPAAGPVAAGAKADAHAEEDQKLGAPADGAAHLALEEARRSAGVEQEKKEQLRRADEAKKEEQAERGNREKAAADTLAAKNLEGRTAAQPQAGAAAPAPPAAPPKPAPAPAPTARAAKELDAAKPGAPPPPAAEAPAVDKAAAKKDDAFGKGEADPKAKRGIAAEPAADPGPSHLTLATLQVAKARPQVEEALKKLGCALPPPAPQGKMMKAPPAESQLTYTIELTDAQIARLTQELDKPGSSRLLPGAPGDPVVLAEFRAGGMLAGGDKKNSVASGGAAAPKKPTEAPKPEAKAADRDSKDGKESEDAPARKALAEGGVEKAGEPRRKVVIHLMEVPYLSERQPAGDAIKK